MVETMNVIVGWMCQVRARGNEEIIHETLVGALKDMVWKRNVKDRSGSEICFSIVHLKCC
jgi:hypothetical protein